MTDTDAAVPKAKSSSRRKQTTSSTSLPHEIDSAGRTRAATRILVKLPKSNASAPADLTPGAEIPELGDTRATTTEGVPLPVPFPIDASDAGSGLPTLQTVSSSSLSGVELGLSETENLSPQELLSRTHLLANAARQASALEASFREGGVYN
ncbi:hypothetical protein DFH08DRAFT_811043 [Mycena albidolilacea]|uniref:Uncharacterized protein n=1 Tax=Mycena albidolilacea TaxID=1033008 RepID=A0AAD6ZXX9_9AGAR|nr:hypothetical protein DFH08DRAFT_811043 [Mycena albidolilacea]